MAISLGATSDHLLRGIDRMIGSVVSVLPVPRLRRRSRLTRAWGTERGKDILIAQVDAVGGFPGSLRWQQRLTTTTLHLTESWLLVGEGTPGGFALPLHSLAGSAVQGGGGLKPPHLTIWYQDGDLVGSFSLGFRGTARGRAGMWRANVWQQQLAELGVQAIDADAARFSPNLHVSWDSVADIVDDEILFASSAWASAGGWFGAEFDIADVWITENTIIWCPAHGNGLNRLPLEKIIDCRNGFGDRLAIGIEDACGGRYDLFFDFANRTDRANHGARVQQLLHAGGVPIGTATPVIAPWRRGGTRRPSDI